MCWREASWPRRPLPRGPKSILPSPWAALYLGRHFSPPVWLLLRDQVEFIAKPQCWHQEYDSPYPATEVFKSPGWWPKLPAAVTNCLVMTQMPGSNFNPAASSRAGMTCSTIIALYILVAGRTANSPGAVFLPQGGYIGRCISSGVKYPFLSLLLWFKTMASPPDTTLIIGRSCSWWLSEHHFTHAYSASFLLSETVKIIFNGLSTLVFIQVPGLTLL